MDEAMKSTCKWGGLTACEYNPLLKINNGSGWVNPKENRVLAGRVPIDLGSNQTEPYAHPHRSFASTVCLSETSHILLSLVREPPQLLLTR